MTNAGLRDCFDAVLSADTVRALKPSPQPYQHVASTQGVPIAEVRLVAAHAWDVSGALAAGCRAAFVARPGAVLSPLGTSPTSSEPTSPRWSTGSLPWTRPSLEEVHPTRPDRLATRESCVATPPAALSSDGGYRWIPRGVRLQNAGVPRPPPVPVRPLTAGDRGWVRATLVRNWSSTTVARRGELIEAGDLSGYVALLGGRRTGLVLVDVRNGDLEVVAISTRTRMQGVGHALIKQCVEQARERGCRRVWLITTNNNTAAIAFYQHIGMDLCAYHRYGVRALRLLKPSIPLRDSTGVRIDHELEFELLLNPEVERGPT